MNKKNKKTIFSLVLLILILNFSFVIAEEEPLSINVLVHSDEQGEWLERVGEVYEQKYNKEVNVLYPNELSFKRGFWGRLNPLNWFRSNGNYFDYIEQNDIDIIEFDHFRGNILYQRGYIEPISNHIRKDYLTSNFDKRALDNLTLHDDVLGVPYSFDIPLFIYNQNFFYNQPKTFNDLLNKTYDLRRQNKNDKYGFLYNFSDFENSFSILQGYGSYLMGTDHIGRYIKEDIGLTNNFNLESVNFIRTMIERGEMNDYLSQRKIEEKFKEGKVGAIVASPKILSEIDQKKIPAKIGELPILPNGARPQQFHLTNSYFLTSNSQKSRSAIRFMLFATRDDILNRWETRYNSLSANVKSNNENELSKHYSLVMELRNSKPMINAIWYETYRNTFNNNFNLFLEEDILSEDILPLIQEKIKENFSD